MIYFLLHLHTLQISVYGLISYQNLLQIYNFPIISDLFINQSMRYCGYLNYVSKFRYFITPLQRNQTYYLYKLFLTHLRLCMAVTGSHAFLLTLNLSPDAMHTVPSLPPIQYRAPSRAATPQLDLLLDILGTACHWPCLGSNLSTEAW